MTEVLDILLFVQTCLAVVILPVGVASVFVMRMAKMNDISKREAEKEHLE